MKLKALLLLISVLLFYNAKAQHAIETDVNVTPYTIYEKPSLVSVKEKVDAIMIEAIREQAFPGAQFMVIKEGEMIFHEAYGYHTYDSLRPVSRSDLYDLASVTKIAGPLPAIMRLVEEGKIDLDGPISAYWESWKKQKDKAALTVREVLAHQAGLKPYIAFMNELVTEQGLNERYTSAVAGRKYPIEIMEGLYLSKKFRKRMYRTIDRSPVSPEKKYKYSGLSFLMYPEIITELTGTPYRSWVRKNIYEKIGATTLMFNPHGWYPEDLIVPTELDTIFRNTLVKGRVHDENAAIMGGVSGNAGLFGTAEDLARLMQLYLNKGVFNGKRIINEETVNEFTRVQFAENGNRRGLGFDKPHLDNEELEFPDSYPAPGASPESFGHSGFTGTFVWADPEGDWVFVFLSNRVYPSRSHRSLYSLHIRGRLMQVFYDSYLNE